MRKGPCWTWSRGPWGCPPAYVATGRRGGDCSQSSRQRSRGRAVVSAACHPAGMEDLLGTWGAGPCRDCGAHSPGRWPGERCRPCWDVRLAERRRAVNDGPTALYRLYDETGSLLYIGITTDPERRWKEHRTWQGWWPAVARKDLVWLPYGGRRAEHEEYALVLAEQPACNQAAKVPLGCPKRPEGGPWFDRAAQYRDWRRWFVVWRDCRLNGEELAARAAGRSRH